MSEDIGYKCIVLIMVLLLWKHGDMTGISLQVVQFYKWFNGKLNFCLKARFLL